MPDIPGGWERTTLGELATIRRGASPRPINDQKWFSEDGPGWVRIADVTRAQRVLLETQQRLSPAGVDKSVSVKPGDLIMSICATIGKPIILGIEACIHDGFVLFDNLASGVHRNFLYYFLQSKEAVFAGKGQPGTQKNLNIGIVAASEVYLPPLSEQREIAAILSSVDEAIEKTVAVTGELRNVKNSLLDEVFGKPRNEWFMAKLSEVVIDSDGLQTGPFGSQLKASEYTGHGVPVIMPKDLIERRVSVTDIARIPEHRAEALAVHRIREGDIVFARRGEIGRHALITDSEEGWLCGTGCLRARCKEGIRPDYVSCFLQWQPTRAWLEDHAVGQTMLNLNTTILGSLPIRVPAVEEQEIIADMFDALSLRERAESETVRALNSVKSSLATALLSGEIRVTPDEVSS